MLFSSDINVYECQKRYRNILISLNRKMPGADIYVFELRFRFCLFTQASEIICGLKNRKIGFNIVSSIKRLMQESHQGIHNNNKQSNRSEINFHLGTILWPDNFHLGNLRDIIAFYFLPLKCDK